MASPATAKTPAANPAPRLWRFVPLAFVLAGMACAYYWRLDKFFTAEQLMARKDELAGFASQHVALASGLFALVYALGVALSLPGAVFLTLAGGFLFGPWLGTALSVGAAATGASAVFLVARTSVGHVLRARAGPWLERFRAGFAADAPSYLLFLRLAPVFPFWLVNIAPALLGVQLWPFVWTTFAGIIPGTFAFALAGASLEQLFEENARAYAACISGGGAGCQLKLSLARLVNPAMLLAVSTLALLSLLPVLVKRWRLRKNRSSPPALPD